MWSNFFYKALFFVIIVWGWALILAMPYIPDTMKFWKEWTNTVDVSDKEWPFEVMEVIDWETIEIFYDWRRQNIRTAWYNAPALKKAKLDGQCYGVESRDFAKEILEWNSIYLQVETRYGWKDKDGYLLAHIFLNDWTYFQELATSLWYWEFKKSPQWYEYDSLIRNAQQRARWDDAGFWKAETCNWEFNYVWEKDKGFN